MAGCPLGPVKGTMGARGYENIAPGRRYLFRLGFKMALPTMWGLCLAGTEAAMNTVEGNSGDACKIKSYDLNYQCIKGYGLMNW